MAIIRNGIDPLTLAVLGRHAPAGRTLLELAPLPGSYSHSALNVYRDCPLRYAFEKVYRIPTDDRKSYFEFGSTIHTAFESCARAARRDAVAAGQPVPGYEVLKGAFDDAWQPRNYADIHAAEHYEQRVEPALRRFYDRELTRAGEQIGFEVSLSRLQVEVTRLALPDAVPFFVVDLTPYGFALAILRDVL